MRKILHKYYVWVGQRANLEKSNIYFSPKIDKAIKRRIKDILGFKELHSSSLYLGNSLVFGKKKTEEFGKLREKVQNKMNGWQNRLLSRAGKITLIKLVVQTIPIYTMSTFKIPITICKSLDSMLRNFWWGMKLRATRSFALKAWAEICQPKEYGGMECRLFS